MAGRGAALGVFRQGLGTVGETGMSHEFRDAGPDDLPGLLALYRHLTPGDPPLDPADAQPDFEALLRSEIAQLLVAEANGALVATCLLLIVPNLTRGGRPFAIVENVVTHAAHRRRGIATHLLHMARDRARAANCYKMMLTTGRSDEGVLHFYEQVGFTRGGKTFFEMRWI